MFRYCGNGSRKITLWGKLPPAVNYPRRKITTRKITPHGILPPVEDYPPQNYPQTQITSGDSMIIYYMNNIMVWLGLVRLG